MAAPTLPSALVQIVTEQTAALDVLRADQAKKVLREIVRARATLVHRIAGLELSGSAPYTLYQHRTYLLQLQAAIEQLTESLYGTLNAGRVLAVKRGARDMVSLLGVSSREFGQSEVPISLREATRLVTGNSRLRDVEIERIRKGAAKYGLEMTERIEGELSQSLFLGESTFQAQQRLLGKSKWVEQAYQAERLARTEFSEAYNATSRTVLDDVALKDPELWIMWHEHAKGPTWGGPQNVAWKGKAAKLDKRVAEDSLRLHGQLRRPGQAFVDPQTMRIYDHPPNRPNDRATLVPVYIREERPRAAKEQP